MVGYAHGAVIAWDLVTQGKAFTLCDFSLQLGPTLQCVWQTSSSNATPSPSALEHRQKHHGHLTPHTHQSYLPHLVAAQQVVNESKEAIDSALSAANAAAEANRERKQLVAATAVVVPSSSAKASPKPDHTAPAVKDNGMKMSASYFINIYIHSSTCRRGAGRRAFQFKPTRGRAPERPSRDIRDLGKGKGGREGDSRLAGE